MYDTQILARGEGLQPLSHEKVEEKMGELGNVILYTVATTLAGAATLGLTKLGKRAATKGIEWAKAKPMKALDIGMKILGVVLDLGTAWAIVAAAYQAPRSQHAGLAFVCWMSIYLNILNRVKMCRKELYWEPMDSESKWKHQQTKSNGPSKYQIYMAVSTGFWVWLALYFAIVTK